MMLYSLNVNGLKSSINKGLNEFISSTNFDFLCLQEIKCNTPLITLDGYYSYWNYCEKRGYSGTAVFSKVKPISVSYKMCDEDFNYEGRIITLEYEEFYLVNTYVPNSQSSLARIDYRMIWDELFFEYINNLENSKPVIICGDFNIAFSNIDSNTESSIEFINNENDEFNNLLDLGFIDAFRFKHPLEQNCYTWWNVGKEDKKNNVGCRLDYFLVSEYFISKIVDSKIYKEISCSDHCPISLEINIGE